MEYVYLMGVCSLFIVSLLCCRDEKEINIILGSSSAARKYILDNSNIEYISISPNINEKNIRHNDPEKLPLQIAKAKSKELMKTLKGQDSILVTADQIVLFDDIREKPVDIEEAKKFLKSYSNKSVKTITSLVVTNTLTGDTQSDTHISTIYFNNITDDDIEDICIPELPVNLHEKSTNYIFMPIYIPLTKKKKISEKVDILNCAGAIAIDHPALFNKINKIEGTMSSVMGLPLDILLNLIYDVK